MIYTPLIQKAISFAIKIHELDTKKRRKGTEIPYITHPLTVGLILSRITDDENIIAAGILHDTIEDCEPYGSVTKELFETEFNENVSRMVNDVTEQDKNLPWKERKQTAFLHIKDMEHDSLLVKSADVLHNLSELNEAIKHQGISFFNNFNASKEDIIGRYQKLIPEISRMWPQNPLLTDLHEGLKRLVGHSSRENDEIITLPSGKKVYKKRYEEFQRIMSGVVQNLNEQVVKNDDD